MIACEIQACSVFLLQTHSEMYFAYRFSFHSLVSVPKPAELLLPRRIPHVELNRTAVGVERERPYFNTQGSCPTSEHITPIRRNRTGWAGERGNKRRQHMLPKEFVEIDGVDKTTQRSAVARGRQHIKKPADRYGVSCETRQQGHVFMTVLCRRDARQLRTGRASS